MLQIKEPSFVDIGGRKLAFDEVSPPNPRGTILLLTGLASTRQEWYKQLEVFGRYYRTIALDNRDVGDSDLSPVPYSIKDLAGDTAAFMEVLGIQRANIIGISMGGFISLELTLTFPQLVEKLVLVSTSGGGLTNIPPSPKLWPAFLKRGSESDPGERIKKIYAKIMGPGYAPAHPEEMEDIARIARHRPITKAAYSHQSRACLSHNATKGLAQIKVPTLVIHGDKDPLVPIGNGKRLAKKIPGANLLIYPGVGHIPIIEKAAQFNQDVLNFLEAT